MKAKGWNVIWKPSRKNITFISDEGQKVRDRNISKTFNMEITKGELLDEFTRNNARREGLLRDDDDERIRNAAEVAELAEYHRQVQEAVEGTGGHNSGVDEAESKVARRAEGEKRSIRKTLAAYKEARRKGRTGIEARENQKQLSEQSIVRKRGRAR
jgi:hypothetical protein